MSIDPGLTNDNCIFIQANAGDGGVHATTGVWWLSPDIQLTGPTSGPDQADVGADNPVVVKAYKKNACTLPTDARNVIIELWAGNPSLAMSPNVNTVQIGSAALIPIGSVTAAGTPHTFTWHVPPGASASDPQGPGHKCLIARVYSDSGGSTPDGGDFHLAEDQHVAQHNITVVAAPVGRIMKLNISTGNPARISQKLTIQVRQDLKPTRAVLAVVEPQLRRLPVFKQISAKPILFDLDLSPFKKFIAQEIVAAPSGAAVKRAGPRVPVKTVATAAAVSGLDVSNFLKADRTTGLFGRLSSPNLQAALALKARAFDSFTLSVDLTKAKSGDAQMLHLVQRGQDGKPHSGLTVVALGK